MIERIVLYKLREELAHDAGRREVAARCAAHLDRLPHVLGVRAGVPADPASARSWDVQLAVRFRAAADVDACLSDPAWGAYVSETLGSDVVFEKAWSFEILG